MERRGRNKTSSNKKNKNKKRSSSLPSSKIKEQENDNMDTRESPTNYLCLESKKEKSKTAKIRKQRNSFLEDSGEFGSTSGVNVICCSGEWSGEVLYEFYVHGVISDKLIEEFRNINSESERLLKLCEVLADINQQEARKLILKSQTVAEFIKGIFVHRVNDGEMNKRAKEQMPNIHTTLKHLNSTTSSEMASDGPNAPGQKKENTTKYKLKSNDVKHKSSKKSNRRKSSTPADSKAAINADRAKKHVYFSDEAIVVKDLSPKTGIPIRYNIPAALEEPVIPKAAKKTTEMTPSPGIATILNVQEEEVITSDKLCIGFTHQPIIVKSNTVNDFNDLKTESVDLTEDNDVTSNKTVHRTQSFPTFNSEKRRKKGVRVSFSSLPPIEFQLEPNPDQKSRIPVKKKNSVKNEDVVGDDLHGKKIEKEECERLDKDESSEKCENIALEIDDINEMLMDFLEEIEAESITVKDCLKDAVKLGIITVSQAKEVLPSFKSRSRKDLNNNPSTSSSDSSISSDTSSEDNDRITSSELHSQSQSTMTELTDDVFDVSEQQSTDKLYDLLASMSLTELTKCREKTLGRLCHLSSYEAYENMQKNAKLSAVYQEDICIQKEEDEKIILPQWEFSPVPPNRTCSLTSNDSDYFVADQKIRSKTNKELKADLEKVKFVLPTLIDEGVLEARQLWAMLETTDKTAQARILASELSKSKPSQLFNHLLQQMPELYWLKELLNNPAIQPPTPHPRRRHSQSFRSSTSSSVIPDPVFAATSTPRRTCSLPRSHAKPAVENPTTNHSIAESDMRKWCKENNIPEKTFTAVHLYGITRLDDLLSATEDDLEEFTGINWMQKAKLWVALENSRLKNSFLTQQNNLNDILKIFEK